MPPDAWWATWWPAVPAGAALVFWLVLLWRFEHAVGALPRLPEPPPTADDDPARPPVRVCGLVPARDEEAAIEPAMRSLLEQRLPAHVDLTVIVVNDGSTDRTPAILKRLAEEDDRLVPVEAPPRPEGWLGKCAAVHHASTLPEARDADLVLLTDADVLHGPDQVHRAVCEMERLDLQHLTCTFTTVCGGFWEWCVVPAGTIGAAGNLLRPEHADPERGSGFGVGAFQLITRAAFDDVGGYGRVRAEVLDDVAFGQAVKGDGHRSATRLGADGVRVRLFPGLRAIHVGALKNVLSAGAASPELAVVALLILSAVQAMPLLLGAAAVVLGVLGSPAAAVAGVAAGITWAAAAGVIARSRRMAEFPAFAPLLHPFGGPVPAVTALHAAWLRMGRGRVSWRGRSYATSELDGGSRDAARDRDESG